MIRSQFQKGFSPIVARYEKILFFGALALYCIPFFLLHYVASLDGPKHLAASNIVGRLWLGDPLFTSLFELNPIYIGNTLGIWIIALFNLIMPAWVAEKLFLLFYVFAFATAFRYLLRSINPNPSLYSLLAFPFVHSSLSQMGYYNFSLAIAFLFFTFGWWIRHLGKLKTKSLLILALLMLVTYLTHIFVFYILLFSIAVHLFLDGISCFCKTGKAHFSMLLTHAAKALLAALPALLLSAFYVRDIMQFQKSSSLNSSEADKLFDLTHFRMLVGFDAHTELSYYHALFLFMALTTLFVLGKRIYKAKKKGNPLFIAGDIFLILTVLLTFLYFFLPDGTDAAGSVGMRLLVLLGIMWALWLAAQSFPFILSLLPPVFMLVFGIKTHAIRYEFLKPLDDYIRQIEVFEKKIPEGSKIATINYSKNWLTIHFQHYLGMERRIVDLRSSTASRFMAYRWKHDQPNILSNAAEMHGFTAYGMQPPASHVVVLEHRYFISEDNQPELRQILNAYYTLTEVSDNQIIALYSLKPADDE